MTQLYEGMVVKIKKHGLINHPGIVTAHAGQWTVIHNSPSHGGVIQSSLVDFANRQKLLLADEYDSTQPAYLIVQNARQAIGKSYSLLSYNCEHFVSEAIGLEPNSPQLRLCSVVLFGLALILAR